MVAPTRARRTEDEEARSMPAASVPPLSLPLVGRKMGCGLRNNLEDRGFTKQAEIIDLSWVTKRIPFFLLVVDDECQLYNRLVIH